MTLLSWELPGVPPWFPGALSRPLLHDGIQSSVFSYFFHYFRNSTHGCRC